MKPAGALPACRAILLASAVSALAACQAIEFAATPTNYPSGVFVIDTASDLGEISPYVLGMNHGPWGELGLNNIEPAKASGITFLRWPGGNWGDRNDLQPWMVDNFIRQAEMMNAEPSITVRLPNSTPEAAAEWVRYVNIEKNYGVKYWAIGNEASLFAADTSLGEETWDAVACAERWREFAQAMKKVDPSIILYGPDTHQFKGDPAVDPKDAAGRDFLREFLRINGDLVDIVTVHRYPFPACLNCGAPSKAELLGNTPEWDTIVPNLRRVIKEVTGKELPVGIMEWNSNWSNISGAETSPDSFLGALWTADVLGRMIRQRPELLAYWTLKSGGTNSGHGLMSSYEIRPSYYVFQMYKKFGSRLLAANADDPMVSLFAAKREDGAVTAIFVNRGDAAVKTILKLDKGDSMVVTEAYLFDQTHNAEAFTPPMFRSGDPVELAPLSVTLLVFEGG